MNNIIAIQTSYFWNIMVKEIALADNSKFSRVCECLYILQPCVFLCNLFNNIWQLTLFPSRSKCTLSAAIFHRLPNVRWKFHSRFCVFGSNFDFWLPIALKRSSSKRLTLPWFLFISLFCIFWTGKRNCVAPLAKQQTPIRPSSDYGQIAPLIFIQTSFQDRISWCFAAFPTYVDEGW